MDSARPSAHPAYEQGDVATRAFYERDACAYAQATRAADLDDLVNSFVARLPARARVLDLGSGSGRDLASFRRRRLEGFGLDRSNALAGLARAHSGAPVVVGDMAALPFADYAFDGAWACASLHHLDADGQRRALAEARRVLRPAGLLLTTMKAGWGEAREACGRIFLYVDEDLWSRRVRDAGFEVIETASQAECRALRDVTWVTSLCRSR